MTQTQQGQARAAPAAGIHLVSHLIAAILNIEVSVLMGANLAEDVAQDEFCEATVGEFQVCQSVHMDSSGTQKRVKGFFYFIFISDNRN